MGDFMHLDKKPDEVEPQSRHVCFNIHKRGRYGETLLDLCLQNSSIVHTIIAKKLIEVYPRMKDDINFTEEYYGNTYFLYGLIIQ
jgi:hypothetical protein